MKKSIFLIILLPLMGSTCRKKGPNCHYEALFTNSSGNKIIFAYPFKSSNDKCMLDGVEINAGGEFRIRERNCLEISLGDGKTLEFIIADPATFIDQLQVDCDSINDKYPILKHYKLTLDELRALDFKITYE